MTSEEIESFVRTNPFKYHLSYVYVAEHPRDPYDTSYFIWILPTGEHIISASRDGRSGLVLVAFPHNMNRCMLKRPGNERLGWFVDEDEDGVEFRSALEQLLFEAIVLGDCDEG